MKAAKNNGHCQCCGGLFKLPNGVLAKHGHKKKYGMYIGDCPGSGSEPIELSCDMVPEIVEKEKRRLSELVDLLREVDKLPMTLSPSDAVKHKSTAHMRRMFRLRKLDIVNIVPSMKPTVEYNHIATDTHGEEWQVMIYANIDPEQRLRENTHKDILNEAIQLKTSIVWKMQYLDQWEPQSLLSL